MVFCNASFAEEIGRPVITLGCVKRHAGIITKVPYPHRIAYQQGCFAYNRTMLGPFHIKIMHLALDNLFSPRALENIIKANLRQDRPLGQIGHDEYHFDNNAFDKSYAYIEQQRTLTISSLAAKDVSAAWKAFGRLT